MSSPILPSQQMASERVRVRQLLKGLNPIQRAELKKLLPARIKAPEVSTGKYPNALLSILPKGDSYSLLGFIAEDLLRLPSGEINLEAVITTTRRWFPLVTDALLDKVRTSKTTQPFIDRIVTTRRKMEAVIKGPLRFEEVVAHGDIEGHPDARTDTQIFEVKLTGQMEENWQSFLYQVFAYAALAPEATEIYLVLPLQETLWHFDPATWDNRQKFREALASAATKLKSSAGVDALLGALLREQFLIGFHMPKLKTLPDTIKSIPDYNKPYQIFLGSNMSSKLNIADGELAAAKSLVQETGAKVFVHSQYIINLCQPAGVQDDYHTTLLIKNLQYASAAGFKGVVVHVGKSTDKPLAEALKNMHDNIARAIQHATPECPLLLETPAGQGSETLLGYSEFVEFCLKFQDPRLRVCVDTCHIFACGHKPLEYIERLTTYNRKLL
ncbi:MAG: hypothetical protein EBS38_08090, partial [Actinobacteria bacterium]|nr:hypothetical protein [Actinomycetota bacterium]